jgi:hypothetical protein
MKDAVSSREVIISESFMDEKDFMMLVCLYCDKFVNLNVFATLTENSLHRYVQLSSAKAWDDGKWITQEEQEKIKKRIVAWATERAYQVEWC